MQKNEEKASTIDLKVPSDDTFLITHNGTNKYYVDPYIFSSYSLFFRQMYFEDKLTEYSIKDKYDEHIFSVFINLSQGKTEKIKLSETFSLQRLSEAWKCDRLMSELSNLIKTQPETEVKIAETVDAYEITNKLPNQKKFKASMIETFIETNSFHYIDRTLLMCFMHFGKQKAVDKRKMNSFIVDHCKIFPDHSTEIVQYIDPQTLTTNELDFFLSCPGTMMLRLITDEAKRRNKTISTNKKVHVEEEEDEEESKESKDVLSKIDKNKNHFLKVTPPLYGLFASISVQCGGDPVLNGKIRISASSNDPSVLVKKNDDSIIVEGNDPYIQIVLPTSIKINKYEIQNTAISTTAKWSLFGSNDFKKWDLIHSVDSQNEQFKPNATFSYKLEKETDQYSIFLLKKFRKPKIDSEYNLNVKYFDVFNDSEFINGACQKLKAVVTTSSNDLNRLASPRHKGSWFSLNLPNQWVQFEFTENVIRPDYYTLKSGVCWFLKSWEVLGSMDGSNWFRIDKKNKVLDLNSKFALKMFDTEKSDDCRFIRIVNTNDMDNDIHILCLSGVEFFGRIRKFKKSKKIISNS